MKNDKKMPMPKGKMDKMDGKKMPMKKMGKVK